MSALAPLRIGVDIGGTFTDLVFARADGTFDRRKVPSTPDDYARAILEGITAGIAAGQAGTIGEITHATTVATNAVIERRGARTALITTENFRDVLELRRIRIPFSYDLSWVKPPPIVPRELRLTVTERIDSEGQVLVPLDEASLERAIDEVEAKDVEAVAVSFLHAYRAPGHEQQVGQALRRRFPDKHISLSSEVLPEMLEFERTSTTVINAYVAPLIGGYLARLKERLAAIEIRAPILVMQSNGGLISATGAAQRPVSVIESGPAAGVVAAARVAAAGGYANVITLDMGGTTTKASIIEQGQILRANEYEVGGNVSASSRLTRGNGYTLRIPVIDISEVGAGGGSLAMIDPGGALRVGPSSAGAVPGPACYGGGNDLPTVTDANVVLGHIVAGSLAGGALKLTPALAEAAIARQVAGPAGISVPEAAHGIYRVANSNMVRAIRSVSVERGRDPKDFALMAFGGAGPIHAGGVARMMGIRRVLVPPVPGVFSALGLLSSEVEHHAARTILIGTRDDEPTLHQHVVDEMREHLIRELASEGFAENEIRFEAAADLRYRDQSSEITVPLSSMQLSEPLLREAETRFEAEFQCTYGHLGERKEFDLVTFRLVASVAREVGWRGEQVAQAATKFERTRSVLLEPGEGPVRVSVLERGELGLVPRPGPLLIQEYDTTIVVPAMSSVWCDVHRNVVIDLESF